MLEQCVCASNNPSVLTRHTTFPKLFISVNMLLVGVVQLVGCLCEVPGLENQITSAEQFWVYTVLIWGGGGTENSRLLMRKHLATLLHKITQKTTSNSNTLWLKTENISGNF